MQARRVQWQPASASTTWRFGSCKASGIQGLLLPPVSSVTSSANTLTSHFSHTCPKPVEPGANSSRGTRNNEMKFSDNLRDTRNTHNVVRWPRPNAKENQTGLRRIHVDFHADTQKPEGPPGHKGGGARRIPANTALLQPKPWKVRVWPLRCHQSTPVLWCFAEMQVLFKNQTTQIFLDYLVNIKTVHIKQVLSHDTVHHSPVQW